MIAYVVAMNNLNTTASDLSSESFDGLRKIVFETPFHYFHLERCRLLNNPPTIEDIARHSNRWTHYNSFMDNGERFDIWINWDKRVKIECNGKIVLQMWAPAGEILQSIDERSKANNN